MDGRGAFVGRKATLLSQLLLDPEPTLKVLCDRLDEIASSCCRRRPLANTPMPKRTANMVIAVTRMGSGGRLSSQRRIFVSTSRRIIADATFVSRTIIPRMSKLRRPMLPLAHLDEPIPRCRRSEFRGRSGEEDMTKDAIFRRVSAYAWQTRSSAKRLIDRDAVAVRQPVGLVCHADHCHKLAEHRVRHTGAAGSGGVACNAIFTAVGHAYRDV